MGNCGSRPDAAVGTMKILVPTLVGTAQITARNLFPGSWVVKTELKILPSFWVGIARLNGTVGQANPLALLEKNGASKKNYVFLSC